MKQFYLAILGLIVMSTSYAQTSLPQGTITMEITDVISDDPQMAAQLGSMKGSETVIAFKDDKSAFTMDMMGGMVKMHVSTDKATNVFNMLMDISVAGQKLWVEDKLDAVETPEQKEKVSQAKVAYDKAKTKKIAGYDCYAFTISDVEGKKEVEGYLAEGLNSKNNPIQGYQSLTMAGFPLEYTASGQGGMSMTISATAVSDKVDEKLFTPDTQGFKKMTMEEFKKAMGGFGGF